jgi:tetratricopeptide (TPR) repeat protein
MIHSQSLEFVRAIVLDFVRNGRRALTVLCIVLFLLISSQSISADKGLDAQTRETLKKADKLRRKGLVNDSEKILRTALDRAPDSSPLKLLLSYVLLKQRRFVEAFALATEVAKAEPKNPRAFSLIGITMLSAGNFRDSLVYLRHANTLNDRESLAWFAAGMLDFYENRMDDALAKLERSVFLDPNEPDFVFALAQVHARAEHFIEAAENYDRYLEFTIIGDEERRTRIKGLRNFLRYLGGKQKLYEVKFNESKTVLPFELEKLRPVVEVQIGKNDKCRFVLDTGSGISVISSKTAERLKIRPIARGGLARAVGGDGKFEIVYGFLRKISLGSATVSNVPVYIRNFHDDSNEVDGYIGLALISKFLTTIDYGERSLTFSRKNAASVRASSIENLGLPLRLTSSGFLSGEVLLDGFELPLNFIVDTGASISVISSELSESKVLQPFLSEDKMRVVGAAGVTENVSAFVLPRVSFGPSARENVKAIALDLDIINEAAGFEQAGILGGNFLMNYRLTFDFQKSRVIFSPIETELSKERMP